MVALVVVVVVVMVLAWVLMVLIVVVVVVAVVVMVVVLAAIASGDAFTEFVPGLHHAGRSTLLFIIKWEWVRAEVGSNRSKKTGWWWKGKEGGPQKD